jgi:guanylate kinase
MSMQKTIIISSPSGCGKDTIVQHLLLEIPNSRKIITCTTRQKRMGEVHGINYYYSTKSDFMKKIENNEFLEWQDVHGELYGTLKSEFENKSEVSFLIIDVLGAKRIQKLIKNKKILIFLKPPNKEELISRILNRSSETLENVKKRMERYDMEIEASNLFDIIVENDVLVDAISQIKNIIKQDNLFK